GHSGSHSVQSMHSSGSMARKLGPSWKQSTGHTSTQSMYLHLMQFSVTTKVIRVPRAVPRQPPAAAVAGGDGGGGGCRRTPRGGEFSGARRWGAAVEGREVVPLAAGRLVLEIAAQGELGAAKGQLLPGDVRRSDQRHFQALRSRPETCLRQGGTEEDVHLLGV